MFTKQFYPTPESVLSMMDLHIDNETILEPSAGKGDIIDYCKNNGAKEVLCCEINEDLATICKQKAKFIDYDFFKVKTEQISHITQIIMNPPFDKANGHILHAWNIAPDGCEITALCNSETIKNFRYNGGSELNIAIEMYGNTYELGNCFNQSERETNVNVICVKLYKPIQNDNIGFEGFYLDAEPETIGSEGIMKHNEIQALVNSYISAIKCFDDFDIINKKMKTFCEPVGMDNGFSYKINYNESVTNKADFAKELQKRSWHYIFNKMNLNKYLTSGVMREINNFVEKQTQVPFTVKNIYRMIEIIVGTKEQTLNRALVEVVDNFTKHTHENRYGVEGWKTNEGHLLNKKFIINYVFESNRWDEGKLKIRYSSHNKDLNDLVKVLCNLTGTDFKETTSLDNFVDSFGGIERNRWYLNGFFSFKGFKKGTIHLKFEDDKVWEILNIRYAKIKGQVLPESTWKKTDGTFDFKK